MKLPKPKPIVRRWIVSFGFAIALTLHLSGQIYAAARTLEFRFELSDDISSEFSAAIPIYNQGSLKVEVEWQPIAASKGPSDSQTTLTLILLRPGGSEAARTSGPSPLRFDITLTNRDVSSYDDKVNWTVKVINGSPGQRREVSGILHTTIPVSAGPLAATEFALLGAGNAKEVGFLVPGSGRLIIDLTGDQERAGQPSMTGFLTVMLMHPAEQRVYARKRGRLPFKIELPVSDPYLDGGARWLVRIENSSSKRVTGRLVVEFSPSE